MKKGMLKIIVGLLFLMMAVNVNALTVKPSGLTTIAPGETRTVNIIVEGASDTVKVSSALGTLTYDTDVFTVVATKVIDWEEASGMNNFSVSDASYTKLIVTSPVTLYTLAVSAKSNAPAGNTTISVTNPACEDEAGDAIAGVVGDSLTVRVESTINTLSALSLTEATIDFSSNITTYNVTVDAATTTISATKTDANATVAGTGVKTLNYGVNKLDVVVTSEAGTTKTYTINVTRTDNRSTNNNLKSLTLSKGTLTFDSTKATYDVDVDKDVSELTIGAEVADTKASFVTDFGPRKVTLKPGLNVILIKVKSEKEEVKTYTLNVTKEDGRSAVNTLKTLTLSNGKLVFQNDVLEYRTTVAFSTTNIDVTYNPTDSKAKVEVTGNKNLIIGENTITIKVTAENETTKEYKIVVKRLNEGEKLPSDNSYLKQLSIGKYNINFNKNTLKYELNIKGEKSLVINAVKEDSTSDIKILGNENLVDGSIIKIIVTSEDGSSRIYQITVNKTSGISPIILYSAIGGVLLLVVVVVIIIINKKKKLNNQATQDNVVYTNTTMSNQQFINNSNNDEIM